MCHLEGTIYNTDKSILINILVDKIIQANLPTEYQDIVIV